MSQRKKNREQTKRTYFLSFCLLVMSLFSIMFGALMVDLVLFGAGIILLWFSSFLVVSFQFVNFNVKLDKILELQGIDYRDLCYEDESKLEGYRGSVVPEYHHDEHDDVPKKN